MNDTLTTASVAAGLNKDRVSVLPAVVEPPANAHVGAIREAHGAMLHPLGPDTAWVATTPPPEKTNAVALDPAGSPPAGLTARTPRAGTLTRRRTVGTAPPVPAGAAQGQTTAPA